jgi:hypothetical protein
MYQKKHAMKTWLKKIRMVVEENKDDLRMLLYTGLPTGIGVMILSIFCCQEMTY